MKAAARLLLRGRRVVEQFFARVEANGDVVEGRQQGWYCVACEEYYTDDELDPGDLWFKSDSMVDGPYRYDGKTLHHLKFPKRLSLLIQKLFVTWVLGHWLLEGFRYSRFPSLRQLQRDR